jgi:hypothetical protein
MNKPVIIGGAFVGAGFLARRCARACRELDWEKLIERMPGNARRNGCSATSPRSARTPIGSWNGSMASARPYRTTGRSSGQLMFGSARSAKRAAASARLHLFSRRIE